MAHVDRRADCALAGIEIGPDGIEGGISMTMIMTGVANTAGRIASLNRSARCSGWTRRLKEPLAPRGICLMACPQESAATVLRPELRAARLPKHQAAVVKRTGASDVASRRVELSAIREKPGARHKVHF